MITIKEAEEILKKEYHIENFEYLMGEILLPDYTVDKHEVEFNNELFSKVTLVSNHLGRLFLIPPVILTTSLQ